MTQFINSKASVLRFHEREDAINPLLSATSYHLNQS